MEAAKLKRFFAIFLVFVAANMLRKAMDINAMFGSTGWRRIAYDPRLAQWAKRAHHIAIGVTQDPKMQADWLVCEGTWFVGVDALPMRQMGMCQGQNFPRVCAACVRSLSQGAGVHHLSRLSKTARRRKLCRISVSQKS